MLTAILNFHSLKSLLPAMLIALSLFAANLPARPAPDEKILHHVVLFKFKEGTTPQRIKEIEGAFRALPSKINLIKSFEWGTNVSPENLAQGYTHCFLLTFTSDQDRDAYLVAPAHKDFGKMLGDSLEKVLVVDFWAQK